MKQLVQFLREVKIELSRVEWPKRNEFLGATLVTLILVFFFTIYIGLIDNVNRWVIYENIFHMSRK